MNSRLFCLWALIHDDLVSVRSVSIFLKQNKLLYSSWRDSSLSFGEMAQFIDSHWNALWTIKIERMTLRTASHFLVIAHENLDYEVLNYWPCLALTSCPKTVGVTETYRHIHQTLTRAISCARFCAWCRDCKADPVTFFLTAPICLDLHQFLPFFNLLGGDWSLLARVMLQVPPSLSSSALRLPGLLFLSTQLAVPRVGRMPGGGGPQPGFIELGISLVGIHIVSFFPNLCFTMSRVYFKYSIIFCFACFSSAILEVTFHLVTLQMTLVTWEAGMVVHSVCQGLSNLLISTHGKQSVLHQGPVHTFIRVDVWFPKVTPLPRVSCGRIF